MWLRSGQLATLDKRLGFGDWFDDLTAVNKQEVVIGTADGQNQIIVFAKDQATSTQRAMCYDYGVGTSSEFRLSGISDIDYAANFRSHKQSQLWAFAGTTCYKYPSSGYTDGAAGTFSTLAEFILNDDIERPKILKSLSLDLPDPNRAGAVTVTVDMLQSGSVDETHSPYVDGTSREATILGSTGGNATGRFRLDHKFMGMRGKIFRIRVSGPSENHSWKLARVHVEYDYDEGGDARSI